MDNYELFKIVDEAIGQAESAECFDYKRELQKRTPNLNGEQQIEIQVLIDVLSYYMNLEQPKQPFEPNLRDLSEGDTEVLMSLYPHFSDDELKARFADVIWTRCEKYEYGLDAIDYYLLSANRLEDWDNWVTYYDRVKRALQLANLLGKKKGKLEDVRRFIKDGIIRIDGADPLYLTGRLLELILEEKKAEVEDFIPILNSIIEKRLKQNEFRLCRYYMDLKATCFHRMKLTDKYEEAIFNIADLYEIEAAYLDDGSKGNIGRIIYSLENAIKTYRKLSNKQSEVDDVRKRLAVYKKQMSGNLIEFSHEIEVSELVEKIRKQFQDKNKIECIIALAYYPLIASKKQLESSVNRRRKNSPLSLLVSTDLVDKDGKRIVKMPDLDAKDARERVKAMEAYMLKEAANNHSIISGIFINNALNIIKEEYDYDKQDFQTLVENNLFVPEDSEQLWLSGLYEGFKGNFIIATHLLIPQIENGFRRFAELCGDTVYTFESDGKEQVKSLNNIFESPNFVDSYDEDLLFNLGAAEKFKILVMTGFFELILEKRCKII